MLPGESLTAQHHRFLRQRRRSADCAFEPSDRQRRTEAGQRRRLRYRPAQEPGRYAPRIVQAGKQLPYSRRSRRLSKGRSSGAFRHRCSQRRLHSKTVAAAAESDRPAGRSRRQRLCSRGRETPAEGNRPAAGQTSASSGSGRTSWKICRRRLPEEAGSGQTGALPLPAGVQSESWSVLLREERNLHSLLSLPCSSSKTSAGVHKGMSGPGKPGHDASWSYRISLFTLMKFCFRLYPGVFQFTKALPESL